MYIYILVSIRACPLCGKKGRGVKAKSMEKIYDGWTGEQIRRRLAKVLMDEDYHRRAVAELRLERLKLIRVAELRLEHLMSKQP